MHYIKNLFIIFKVFYLPFTGADEDVDLIWSFRMGIKIISFHEGMEGRKFLGKKEKHLAITNLNSRGIKSARTINSGPHNQ